MSIEIKAKVVILNALVSRKKQASVMKSISLQTYRFVWPNGAACMSTIDDDDG